MPRACWNSAKPPARRQRLRPPVPLSTEWSPPRSRCRHCSHDSSSTPSTFVAGTPGRCDERTTEQRLADGLVMLCDALAEGEVKAVESARRCCWCSMSRRTWARPTRQLARRPHPCLCSSPPCGECPPATGHRGRFTHPRSWQRGAACERRPVSGIARTRRRLPLAWLRDSRCLV